MKFKIDENLPTDLAEFLRNEGYDAITVLDHDLVK
jgi:predicted nuclease of predicted toxin-antitoxin system